jgi:hypothetical protein
MLKFKQVNRVTKLEILTLFLFISPFTIDPAFSAPPISITKISTFKKYDALIALKVTSKNNTNRNVRLAGNFYAKTSDGLTYEFPDFETLQFYGVYGNPCGGNGVDGYWNPGQVASATWCFAVPKGKTIVEIYVASNRYATPLVSKKIRIKN